MISYSNNNAKTCVLFNKEYKKKVYKLKTVLSEITKTFTVLKMRFFLTSPFHPKELPTLLDVVAVFLWGKL